jgi:hypothetical protein
MEHDKKCPACHRWYRGEGYKDLCTQSCWYTVQRLSNKAPKHVSKYQIIPPSTKKTPDQIKAERIQRDNAIWAERAVPKESLFRKDRALKKAMRSPINGVDGWMKKFNAVRG